MLVPVISAGDLVVRLIEIVTVNEHVSEPLPGDPVTLSSFPELPPGEDTLQRYHRLKHRDDLGKHARSLDNHGFWRSTSQRASSDTGQRNDTPPQFQRIRSELNRLREHAQVTVVQCDKEIRRTFPLNGPLSTIAGRGGTDLRPALRREFLNQHRPSQIFYFTDGDGPVPDQPPSVPVVWCLTHGGQRPAAWGKVVHLA